MWASTLSSTPPPPQPTPQLSLPSRPLPTILHSLRTHPLLPLTSHPLSQTLTPKELTLILSDQTDPLLSLRLLHHLHSLRHPLNSIHYNVVLRLLAKHRLWPRLKSLLSLMRSRDVPFSNSTYGTLIHVLARAGFANQSFAFFGLFIKSGLRPDAFTTSAIALAYKKACDFEASEKVILNSSSSTSGLGVYGFNSLIDTYGKAGRVEDVVAVFEEMIRSGVTPNTVTFNSMIHVYGNCGRLEEVKGLLGMMGELGCRADTRTFNILISVYTKMDDVRMAGECLEVMKRSGVSSDVVSYRTLLYAYSIRKMVAEAEGLVAEMEERGLEIDEFTQSALTRMYIDASMFKRSWAWFEKFQEIMSSECFAANIDAFGVHGLLVHAENGYRTCLRRKKLGILVFNVMIKIYGIAKEYDKACKIFDEMETHGVSPDKCTYNSIVQILSSAELPHRAEIYLQRMQEAGFVTDCIPYSAVISSFSKLGEVAMAENLFKEMIGHGVQPDIVVFGVLINSFADARSVCDAKKYVEVMENAGFRPNSIICNSLIKLYAKVGLLQEAQVTYELAQSLDAGPDVYSSNCMIKLYCENAMVTDSEKIFKALKERGEANEFSFSMMLCMYKNIGRISEAFAIAKEMLDSRLTDVLSYNTVIELYALNGRFRHVVTTFQKMVSHGIEPNDATFRVLGTSLIQRGVSKSAVNQLESARKKDGISGLQAWIESVQTMLGLSEDFRITSGKMESMSIKVDFLRGNGTRNKFRTAAEPEKNG